MKTLLAYITAKDKDEARKISATLLERRLAGCVNILNGMESHYWWEGKLEKAEECVVLAKTFLEKSAELEKCVREVHTYSIPCILFLPVESGSKPYIQWLQESCKGESK